MTETDKYKDAWLSSNQTINKLEGIISTLESFHKSEIRRVNEKHDMELEILQEENNRLQGAATLFAAAMEEKSELIITLHAEVENLRTTCEKIRLNSISNLELLKKEYSTEKSNLIAELIGKHQLEMKSLTMENQRLMCEAKSMSDSLSEKDDIASKLRISIAESNSKSKRESDDAIARVEALTKEFLQEKSRLQEDAELKGQQIKSLKLELQETTNSLSMNVKKSEADLDQLKLKLFRTHEESQITIDALNKQIAHQQAQIEASKNEMKLILQREEKLRNDSGRSSTEVEDMRRRLASIQEHLRQIESDHLSEISRLKSTISAHEKRVWEVTCDRDKTMKEKILLDSKFRESENTIYSLKSSLAEAQLKLENSQRDASSSDINRMKLESELKERSKRISELESSTAELRHDRDDADSQRKRLTQLLEERESSVSKLQSELAELRKQAAAAELQAKQAVVVAHPAVSELERLLAEKAEEVSRLTQTVRRECEERTSLLVEVSCLKDKLQAVSSTGVRGYKRAAIVPEDLSYEFPGARVMPTGSSSADPDLFPSSRGVSLPNVDSQTAADDSAWSRHMSKAKHAGGRPGRGRHAK